MNAWVNACPDLSQGSYIPWKTKEYQMYVHILMSLADPCVWSLLRKTPLCILVTHFQGEIKTHGGELTWKEPGNLFCFSFFFFCLLLNLAISHFPEVSVPLTHSQGPGQSPFVNRTMFYNSPSLSDDHINNAEEPYLSRAMRLFLWFGLAVMVIVWQTIYSSNNDYRLQLFSDQRDCRETHDWLLTKRQSQAVQPPHLTFAFLLW